MLEPHTEIAVVVPPGVGLQEPIRVVVSSRGCVAQLDRLPPSLVAPGLVPTYGGVLRLSGLHLGSGPHDTKVLLQRLAEAAPATTATATTERRRRSASDAAGEGKSGDADDDDDDDDDSRSHTPSVIEEVECRIVAAPEPYFAVDVEIPPGVGSTG